MPLLTINSTVAPESKESFFGEIAELYADVMESETEFLSVNFRPSAREDLWLGRADPDAPVVVLEADVRAGRSLADRREFALRFMERVRSEWALPAANMKVVFTEHEGSHMMGYDRVGEDWSEP